MLIYNHLYYNFVTQPTLQIDTIVSYGARAHVTDLFVGLYVFDGLGTSPAINEGILTPEDIAKVQEILCI